MCAIARVRRRASRGSWSRRTTTAIADAVRAHGYEAVMTGEHPNGTSRIAEAVERLHLGLAETVVNVQGDEPEIEPGGDRRRRDRVEEARRTRSGVIRVRLGRRFPVGRDGRDPDRGRVKDPNVVKVVLAYRARVPASRRGAVFQPGRDPARGGEDATPPRRYRHVGIYAYTGRRRCAGTRGMPPTPLGAGRAARATPLARARVLDRRGDPGLGPRGSTRPSQYEAFVARSRPGLTPRIQIRG